jgi:hypothetical protein
MVAAILTGANPNPNLPFRICIDAKRDTEAGIGRGKNVIGGACAAGLSWLRNAQEVPT